MRRLLTGLFILIAAVGVYFNSNYAIPFGDDFCYAFRIIPDEEMEQDVPLPPIENFGDIISGQALHYQITNGRVVVHTLVQVFDGFHLELLFRILNAGVFALSILLILKLSGVGGRNFLVTTAITGAVLFLMPECGVLYYTPALSINYLWALCGTLLFLWVWKNGERMKWWEGAVLAPFMFLPGWSHEAFSLPVAGVMLGFYIWKRRELGTPRMLLALFYCLGALALLAAPGNYVRLGKLASSPGVISWIYHHTLNCFLNPWLLIALAFLFFGWKRHRSMLQSFLIENWLIVAVWVMTIIFAFIIGATSRGSLAVDIFSVMLIASLIMNFFHPQTQRSLIYGIAMGTVVVILQWMVIGEQRIQRIAYDSMVEAYLADNSGVAVYEVPPIGNPLVRNWVESWESTMHPEDEFDVYRRNIIKHYYQHPEYKALVTLSEEEKEILSSPDSLPATGTPIPGTAGFYEHNGVRYLIRPIDPSAPRTASFKVYSQSNEEQTLKEKIKARLYGKKENPDLQAMKIEVDNHFYYIGTPVEGHNVRIDLTH